MKFSKVALSYGPADSFVFPLDDGTFTAPYVVRSIDGLEPPDITVSNQTRKAANRQLVIFIGIQPNFGIGETPEDLRDLLYELLTPKLGSPVTFSLMNSSGTVLATTYGQVSKFEGPLFAKESVVQLTIPCEQTYLEAPKYTHPSPGTINKNPLTINNPGNAPTGFDITFTLTAATSVFTFTNANGTEKMQLNYPFAISDEVRIRTRDGEKNITVKRGAVTTSLLPYLSVDSKYIQLHRGNNLLTPTSQNFTVTALSYYPRYWGA